MAEFFYTLFHGSKRCREARAEFDRIADEALAASASLDRTTRELSARMRAESPIVVP